jgi:hypothetical protein
MDWALDILSQNNYLLVHWEASFFFSGYVNKKVGGTCITSAGDEK